MYSSRGGGARRVAALIHDLAAGMPAAGRLRVPAVARAAHIAARRAGLPATHPLVVVARTEDEARLAGVIRYRRVSTPEEFVQKLMPALDHWFNHQTHHRGHAHMILTSLGKTAPELDLLYYQREAEAGRA